MDEYTRYWVEQLKIDRYYASTSDEELTSDQGGENEEGAVVAASKPRMKSKRKNSKGRKSPKESTSEGEDEFYIHDTEWLSKRQRKKHEQRAVLAICTEKKESVKARRERRRMERQIRNRDRIYDFSKIEDIDIHCWGHFCSLCSAEFTTKKKLLDHLKKTGHAVGMPHQSGKREK